MKEKYEYVAEVIGGGYVYNPVEEFNTIGQARRWAREAANTGKCVVRTQDGKVVTVINLENGVDMDV